MTSTTITFCKRLLQTIAIAHIGIGLCFPFLINTALFTPYFYHLYQAFHLPPSLDSTHIEFMVAIFGPTLASWGVLFLYAVNTGFHRPHPQAWWLMLAACLAWAPYDSLLSLNHGVYLNAIINAIVFSLILIPLLMTKQYFYQSQALEL